MYSLASCQVDGSASPYVRWRSRHPTKHGAWHNALISGLVSPLLVRDSFQRLPGQVSPQILLEQIAAPSAQLIGLGGDVRRQDQILEPSTEPGWGVQWDWDRFDSLTVEVH